MDRLSAPSGQGGTASAALRTCFNAAPRVGYALAKKIPPSATTAPACKPSSPASAPLLPDAIRVGWATGVGFRTRGARAPTAAGAFTPAGERGWRSEILRVEGGPL